MSHGTNFDFFSKKTKVMYDGTPEEGHNIYGDLMALVAAACMGAYSVQLKVNQKKKFTNELTAAAAAHAGSTEISPTICI
jgi:drug/metabolite transporter (DMT)-like permease